MAKVLNGLDAKHVYTIHNSCGIDEAAPIGINYITEVIDGDIESLALTNEDFNIPTCSVSDIISGNLEENLKIAINILKNYKKDARYNTVLMNAALAIRCADKASDIKEGIEMAKNSLETGNAFKKLDQLIEASGGTKEKLMNLL
jgi:anthranilate phosphoribosyltransferase